MAGAQAPANMRGVLNMKVILTQTKRPNEWNVWILFADGSYSDQYETAKAAWRIAWHEHRNNGATIEVVPY